MTGEESFVSFSTSTSLSFRSQISPFSETLSSLLSGALNFVGVGGLLGLNSNGKVTRPDELITAKIVSHQFRFPVQITNSRCLTGSGPGAQKGV